MNSSSRKRDDAVDSVRAHAGLPSPTASSALASASAGVLAGGVVGSFAGPIGVIAGSVIGAVTGAAAGVALDDHTARAARRQRKLDEAIGVIGGNLGARAPGAKG